ncbi:MAG: hypothetical protein OYL97_03240 [Candidatus Poribacteria bacterium]|nr:hypothetical protein [Candidatus Poribacteria bacterium]
MHTILTKSTFAFVIVTLIVITNMGCGLSVLEQNRETATPTKPQESVFIVVDTANVEAPTLVGSVQLPFRVGLNNNVVLSGQDAYVMTAQHLHVVNLSDEQHPSLVASMPFPDKVGSAKLSGKRLFVAGPREIYIVDVSNPNHPSLQSTTRTITSLGPIKDFDVHNAYLYVMDTGYYLHIFDVGTAKFVEAMPVSRSRLVGVRAKGEFVQLIQSESSYFSQHIWREILDRQDLLELSARYEKLRVSKDYLLFTNRGHPTGVITVAREDHQAWDGGQFEHYNMEIYYSDYLRTKENERLNTQEIADVVVSSEGVAVNNLDRWHRRIDTEVNILGPITDFQISRDFLYVSNLNGFLSIIHLFKTNRPFQRDEDRFLSVTTLGAFRPMSIAVGENYAGVLCDLSDLK